MSLRIRVVFAAVAALFLAACGGEPAGPNGLSLSCGQIPPTTLGVGASTIVDPTAQGACVAVPSVPSAGADSAEHLYVAVSTAGAEVTGGVTAPYSIAGQPAGATTSVTELPSPLVSAFQRPTTATQFHRMLREREHMFATHPAYQLFRSREGRTAGPSLALAPPPANRSFFVCTTTRCNDFVTVTATLKHLADKIAIYVDDAATIPQSYSPAELSDIARIFDDYLYPIDKLNFGDESDIDANGVVQVLFTPRINALSGNCNTTQSVILGYFFSLDLQREPNGEPVPNSNGGEVFYSLVPDPFNTQCTIGKEDFAKPNLAPTFVHEFQHMISYNQHAILRNGDAEDTWLNEGLSHYAEELAGRIVPDTAGQASGTTYTQYALSNYLNAYDYLSNPEATFLISPLDTGGSLEERGAGWLFVRWAADQFGTSAENLAQFRARGTDFTQALVQTELNGAVNVAAVAGDAFATLVTQWQLANYLDNLPGFMPASVRLSYINFDLRLQFGQLHDQRPSDFGRRYPLVPDSASTGAYSRVGTLRQGSGPHVLIIQGAGAQGVQFLLSNTSGGTISATAVPRVGLVRVR